MTGEKASDYLQQAAARASGATPIVIAYDLKDAVALPEAMHTIMGDPPEALANVSDEDAAELAKLFASLRGVTLTISADKEPRGEAIVNFGQDASKLGANAKPVLLELLGQRFARDLELAMAVYPDAAAELTEDGIRLQPSPPPVPPKLRAVANSRTLPADD